MLWRRLVKAVIPLYPPWKGTPDFPLPPYRVGVGRGGGASPSPLLSRSPARPGALVIHAEQPAQTPLYIVALRLHIANAVCKASYSLHRNGLPPRSTQ